MHSSLTLETIFSDLFSMKYRTHLLGGSQEPLYLPGADAKTAHKIIYKEDYFASALHEISHWCIAGSGKRQELDYGYWYIENRTNAQQLEFQQFEQRPQALEWIFSTACQFPFRLSYDNLESTEGAERFGRMVQENVFTYLHKGLPVRAAGFARCLAEFFGGVAYLDEKVYSKIPN